MVILDRYIGRAVSMGIMSVLLVMITLDSLINFAGETSEIGKAHYTFWQASYYILLNIPQKVYQMFPMVALLGTMVSMGMLAGHSELVAIRASGVSIARIALSVLKTGIILTAVVIAIGEFVAPPAVQYAKLNRVAAMESKISLNTDYGLWARDGNNYIHIRRVENDGRLVGINLYIFDDTQTMVETISASTGEYVDDHWELHRVTQRYISKQHINEQQLKTLRWDSILNPDVVNVVSVTPESLSIWKLRNYIDYLQENKLDSREYELSFWSKLVAPFTIAVMIILALPFAFGSLRNVGAGQRILVGFILGLGFFIFNQFMANAGLIYHFHPAIAAVTPTLLVFIIGMVLLKRTR